MNYFRIEYLFVDNNNIALTPKDAAEDIEEDSDEEDSEGEDEPIEAVPCNQLVGKLENMSD